MKSKDRRIFPLLTLRPFEAAARFRSMSAAARELGVTQPAVSRHLDALDAALGQPVFRRSPKGLELTEVGHILLKSVTETLSTLDETVAQIREPHRDRTIWLAMNTGLAHFWLSPRLAKLRSALPNVYLRLLQTDRDDELSTGDYDLAIRFGNGRWKNCTSSKLLAEIVVPVSANEYLRTDDLLRKTRTSTSLTKAKLLHLDQAGSRWLTWPMWFEHQGLRGQTEPPPLTYSAYPLLLQAAVAGEGVALGWYGLVDNLLKSGDLVAVGDVVRRDTHGYFLCKPSGRSMTATKERLVARLANWIATEFKEVDSH